MALDPYRTTGWFAVSKRQTGSWYSNNLKARYSVSKPDLNSDEIAIKVNLAIPRELFDDPRYEVSLELSDTDPVDRPDIDLTLDDPPKDESATDQE